MDSLKRSRKFMARKTFTLTAWGRDGIRVCARTHFLLGLTGNCAQVLQQPLQRRARFLEGTLGIQKRLGGAVDGSALRVAEDQHQAAAQIARAEFQAAKNAAFCLSCLLRLSSNRFCNLSRGRQQPASNSDQAACVQVLPALRSTKMSPHEDKTRGHAGWKFQPRFMVVRMAPLFPAKHRPLRTDDFQAVKFAKTPPRHKQVHSRQDGASRAWHGVEDSLQGHARVGAANDRRARGLALLHQLLADR